MIRSGSAGAANSPIDVGRYEGVFQRLFKVLSKVLPTSSLGPINPTPPSNWVYTSTPDMSYGRYMQTDIEKPVFKANGARGLVKRIAEECGYNEIYFVPMPGAGAGPSSEYVSWLYMERGESYLAIRYDPERAKEMVPNGAEINGSWFHKNARLEMAFWHEAGHIILHLDKFLNRLADAPPKTSVWLDPIDEEEAWFLASMIRGIFTGSHAVATRYYKKSDKGWQVIV